MPSNIIVNSMTTQHKMSIGVTTAFPDVCKTPAPPAPSPVPIPYPNVGNSIMASDKVTKRVSDNKQKVMVKDSAYTLSNGDQPGVALGVVSNKIMGKSVIKNQSFDVKFENKGVGRLKDPHGNNSGSKPNAVAPMEGQSPAVGMTADEQKAACERLKEKHVADEDRPDVSHKYGMTATHAQDVSDACVETGMSATMRATNPDCLQKIGQGFATKPCGAAGKTISDPGSLPGECKGLVGMRDDAGRFTGVNSTNGVIGADELHAARSTRSSGEFNNWLKDRGAMTGDYDMHDVFDSTGKRATNASAAESGFINSANDAMGRTDPDTRMIQHGPQANVNEYFEANPDSAAKARENFGEQKFKDIQQPDVKRKPPEPLLHFDNNGEMYEIETEDELKDLYACKGAEYPAHWK